MGNPVRRSMPLLWQLVLLAAMASSELSKPLSSSRHTLSTLDAALDLDPAKLVEDAQRRKDNAAMMQYFVDNAASYSAGGANLASGLSEEGIKPTVADSSSTASSSKVESDSDTQEMQQANRATTGGDNDTQTTPASTSSKQAATDDSKGSQKTPASTSSKQA